MSDQSNIEGIFSKGNPFDPQSKRTRIQGTIHSTSYPGQEAIIQHTNLIRVGAFDASTHRFPFIVRTMENSFPSRTHEAYYEQVLEKYRRLKSLHLPVLPTFRFDLESNSYIMTDLTADGSIIIDKHTDPLLVLQCRIDNAEQLREELLNIATQAYNHGEGVLPGYDAFTLTVLNNHGRIRLLDIFTGSYLLNKSRAQQLSYPVGVHHATHSAQSFYNDFIKPLVDKNN